MMTKQYVISNLIRVNSYVIVRLRCFTNQVEPTALNLSCKIIQDNRGIEQRTHFCVIITHLSLVIRNHQF